MTIQQLKYIIEIVESGSFSAAAKNLFISQPSLTNAIKDIEKEYGITLFIRSNKGVTITNDGKEFVGYARGVIEQEELLNTRFLNKKPPKMHFVVSSQHYSFVVNTFMKLIKKYGAADYDFTLRETRTFDVIDDVRNFVSDYGIIYLDDVNKSVIIKTIKEFGLTYEKLFSTQGHVFIGKNHPLADKKSLTLRELDAYPRVSFEQGKNNSLHFSEEMFSDVKTDQEIRVSDRATLSNFLVGVNGYTLCSGVIDENLNGEGLVAIPLDEKRTMTIIIIKNPNAVSSSIGLEFIELLKNIYSSKL